MNMRHVILSDSEIKSIEKQINTLQRVLKKAKAANSVDAGAVRNLPPKLSRKQEIDKYL